jgi:predicted DNA-binding WGR domain protein
MIGDGDSKERVPALGWEFRCTEGRSNKFYRMLLVDSAVVVQYARIGAVGNVTVYPCGSHWEAKAKAKQLVNDKNRKGYVVQCAPTEIEVPVEQAARVNAGDQGCGRTLLNRWSRETSDIPS